MFSIVTSLKLNEVFTEVDECFAYSLQLKRLKLNQLNKHRNGFVSVDIVLVLIHTDEWNES